MKRGRLWGFVAILVPVTLGAVAAYLFVPLSYRSVGMIRIRADLPFSSQINAQDAERMTHAMLQMQIEMIRSPRAVDLAMQQPSWKGLGRGVQPEAVTEFKHSIRVRHPKHGDIIRFSFTDKTPDGAAAGVTSLTDALEKIFPEDDTTGRQRMRFLEERCSSLQSQLKSLDDRMQALGKQYGTDNLAPIWDFKLQELLKLESELKSVQTALATALATGAKSDELRAQEAVLKARLQQMQADVLEIGQRRLEMDRLRSEAGPVRSKLTATKEEIERLTFEQSISPSRFSVMSRGETPTCPVMDQRIIVAGGAAAGLIVGLVILICLRMLRHSRSE